MVKVYTDGSCLNNANTYGKMGIGINIKGIKNISQSLGTGTNIIAEYTAIIKSLEELNKLNLQDKHITIFNDNLVVTNQLNSLSKTRCKTTRKLHNKVFQLLNQYEFKKLEFKWVSRKKNKKADRLSKACHKTFVN